MNGKQLIEGLQGTKVRRILSSLMYASEMLQNDDVDRQFIDKMYHSLIPLLMHNHYKIRALAFNTLLQLLSDYEDCLSCPDIALGSCILGLQCVNKSISEVAATCLKRIMDMSEIDSFWVEIEETIRTHRSTDVRLKVLEILVAFADRIPLKPILSLLDDPKAQIRFAAKAILDAADPDAVRAAICSAKLSYETTQELMRKYNLRMEDLVAPVNDHHAASYATKMRGRAAKCRKAVEDLKQGSAARSAASPGSVKRRGGMNSSSEGLDSGSQARPRSRKQLVSSVALARAEQRRYLDGLRQQDEEEEFEFLDERENRQRLHASAGPVRRGEQPREKGGRPPFSRDGRSDLGSEKDYQYGKRETRSDARIDPAEREQAKREQVSEGYDQRRRRMDGDEQYRRGRSDVEMSSSQKQSRREPVSEGYDTRRRKMDDDERSRRSRSDVDTSVREEQRYPKREPVSEGYDPRRRRVDDDERSRRSRSDVDTSIQEQARMESQGSRRREQSVPSRKADSQSDFSGKGRPHVTMESDYCSSARIVRKETESGSEAWSNAQSRASKRSDRSIPSREQGKEYPGASTREFLRVEAEVQGPLGKIIRPPRVSLPVQPRDLSKATWLEKISFLDMLKDCLAKNMRFKESPSQIIDCVLTTSITEHKRVTFLIPPILSELILRHPEVLRSYLNQIMTFTLNTMFHESSKTDPDFNQFLSVLFVEADPTELIDKALKICDKTPKKLPFGRFVRKLYKARDDIVLPYNILAHLVSSILKTADCEKLLALVCVYEFKSVQRFGANQTEEVRQRLLPFMKAAHAK